MKIDVPSVKATRRFYKKRSIKLSLGQATADRLGYMTVIQGESLSALFYILFINSLPFRLDEMSQSEQGVPVNNLSFIAKFAPVNRFEMVMQKLLSLAPLSPLL